MTTPKMRCTHCDTFAVYGYHRGQCPGQTVYSAEGSVADEEAELTVEEVRRWAEAPSYVFVKRLARAFLRQVDAAVEAGKRSEALRAERDAALAALQAISARSCTIRGNVGNDCGLCPTCLARGALRRMVTG